MIKPSIDPLQVFHSLELPYHSFVQQPAFSRRVSQQ
jgi:hypothetical protein